MDLNPDSINKILIIKLAAIGDVMFASPLIANLKANFPYAEVHWLADPWTKDVVEHFPRLDKVLFYGRPQLKKNKLFSYLAIPWLYANLRTESYDLAIIPHRSDLAFKLAKLAGIPLKVGFTENTSNKNLDVAVKYDCSKHEVERNLDLLRTLDLKISTNKMVFKLNESLIQELKGKYFDKEAQKFICIAPGGGSNPGLDMPLKRWPKEKCADLAVQLQKLGFQVILVGSGGDQEICDFISKRCSLSRESEQLPINLCNKTTLVETAAIVKCCDLYIGNDSGLLYIAAAVGVPTLGIFGPTDPRLLAPITENSAYLLNKTECSPCYHPQSTMQGKYENCTFDQKCLKELAVEPVFEKALKLLKQNG